MQIDYPLRFDDRGRAAATTEEDHIRDMIEQVLFTAPGERVNRPEFGSGLMRLVFGPSSDEVATATRFLVQGALQQWLGELITIEDVDVSAHEAMIEVTVEYTIRRTRARRVSSFTREV